ncbi:MAG: hypothetical protein COV74_07260 [Candidatus Omnitrophica bacterium CG11_big_fil_rev_8_21_14_0_20_45_26]|uniref:Response regulatory domain-containing protein n=1 Tax=Candidatus Abzuiibacterium crystallinum TaxID=1974748 RepID=A0A2H0LN88_9BACT|nr:MAG: hypothetical protein COV74_07260 [Candidatus Omnitrophica bacterium CG11_big_fil_rev_8_21_14_0_20_45_26]PIW65497.1 MAG: hypothetical protein COW12_01520 [Candidatus Omnitrophica bacterium CG12_big_fil_rev_8_21_14_0_65_45_16]
MKKILIVDDEPDICEGIASYLAEVGYQTMTATRGQEGYDLILKERPDLVILDIALPDLDGTVLYENLRKDPAIAQTRILFLTALAAGAPDQFKGIDREDYTIISKPVKFETLQAEVERMLKL